MRGAGVIMVAMGVLIAKWVGDARGWWNAQVVRGGPNSNYPASDYPAPGQPWSGTNPGTSTGGMGATGVPPGMGNLAGA